MSKFFLTGGSGFIGRNMVKYLEEQGHEVYVNSLRSCMVKRFTGKFEFINLAAFGNHYQQKDLASIVDANIIDLHNYLEMAKTDDDCDKFYNVSTSAIQLPKDTLYSVSKRFGELMVESYNDPRFVNIRPYSVYGPGEADHRFIPTVIRALHSGETIQLDEEARHDWIFVEDFIEAMFDGHTNIGTGISYKNLDIVWVLEHLSGKKLNYVPAKLRSYDTKDWVCPTKDIPCRSIEEGLKQTYEHFTR